MDELRLARDILGPVEVIYVGDAMTGQDAVRSAKAFEERIGLTSVILTKLDGDARGGAALSILSATGRPIKFIGVGEKPDKLEVFHPERMASRILGMGDILSLIEKAQGEAEVAEAEEMARKLRKQEFTLDDFKKQIRQMKKIGSLADIVGHLPQVGPFKALGKARIVAGLGWGLVALLWTFARALQGHRMTVPADLPGEDRAVPAARADQPGQGLAQP